MIRHLFFLFLISSLSLQAQQSIISEHVTIVISTYVQDNETRASAMPELKGDSKLMPHKRRFEYLLINVSAIHSPDKAKERMDIWKLYPDTVKLKRLYLNKFAEDKKLNNYFGETLKYIRDPAVKRKTGFTQDELMEVASKFFYCDQVMPDSSIQAHVCIGLNGIKEAAWTKDYTLLQAFCYEAIFNDLDRDTSLVWDSFGALKKESVQKYRGKPGSLEQYLNNVKLEVFERMKNNPLLKDELLAYYEMNKNNLAFEIIK
jgi:hypothetical protein